MGCKANSDAKNFEFDKNYSVYGSGDNRVILIHGIWSDKSYWETGYAKELKEKLVENNFQVITFTFPNTTDETWVNNGLTYRRSYLNYMNWLLKDLDDKYPISGNNIVGGFSFGGLHAMVAASDIEEINNYFAIMPSMDISRVVKNVSNKNFYPIDSKLINKSGFVISGSKDTLVNYKLSESWALGMGSSVKHILIDSDHRLNQEIIELLKSEYKPKEQI